MTFFNKVNQGANKLFNKINQNAPVLLRKIDNTAQRMTSAIAPTLQQYGFDTAANAVNGINNDVHQIRNNLERAIKAPVSDLRKQYA